MDQMGITRKGGKHTERIPLVFGFTQNFSIQNDNGIGRDDDIFLPGYRKNGFPLVLGKADHQFLRGQIGIIFLHHTGRTDQQGTNSQHF